MYGSSNRHAGSCGVGREGSQGGAPPATASSFAALESGGRTSPCLINSESRVTDRAEYVRCVVWIEWSVCCVTL